MMSFTIRFCLRTFKPYESLSRLNEWPLVFTESTVYHLKTTSQFQSISIYDTALIYKHTSIHIFLWFNNDYWAFESTIRKHKYDVYESEIVNQWLWVLSDNDASISDKYEHISSWVIFHCPEPCFKIYSLTLQTEFNPCRHVRNM